MTATKKTQATIADASVVGFKGTAARKPVPRVAALRTGQARNGFSRQASKMNTWLGTPFLAETRRAYHRVAATTVGDARA